MKYETVSGGVQSVGSIETEINLANQNFINALNLTGKETYIWYVYFSFALDKGFFPYF